MEIVEKLIPVALAATMAAAAAGQLPKFVQTVRTAQLELLRDSRSSRWGTPFLLEGHGKKTHHQHKSKRSF